MIVLPSLNSGATTSIIDADAVNYINQVEIADNQKLEEGVELAIINFVRGCKSDTVGDTNNWNQIQAACILCAARTLTGALVPLKGLAPTNNGFDSSNYSSRKTGLKGNGTKYLSSNYSANSTLRDDHSFGVYVSQTSTLANSRALIGCGGTESTGGFSQILTQTNLVSSRNRSATPPSQVSMTIGIGFYGSSRNNGSNYNYNYLGNAGTFAVPSNEPSNETINVFTRRPAELTATFDRLSFYWIGRNIDLAKLNSRISTFMSTLDSVIP
jgi:hypothetical protein